MQFKTIASRQAPTLPERSESVVLAKTRAFLDLELHHVMYFILGAISLTILIVAYITFHGV